MATTTKPIHAAVDWLDRRGWVGRFPWLRHLRRIDGTGLLLLAGALAVVFIGRWFLEFADDVGEGDTLSLDKRVLLALRRPDDPGLPVGPAWLREVGIDLTALGSVVVVSLGVAAVAGYLLIHRRFRLALLVLASTGGGMLLNTALKHWFDRPRPEVVPHLREVMTPSFPSGHATLSAVVYLTLGALLAGAARGRVAKLYCLAVAMILTFLVGVSRVYLGVHYPSDVLAGWAVGLGWALLCGMVERFLKWRGSLRGEAGNAPSAPDAGA